MITQMFSVYDSCARSFNAPFFLLNEQMARRIFFDTVMNPDTTMHRNPQDYFLFHMGSFDDQTGRFEQLVAPMRLAIGTDVMSRDGGVKMDGKTGRVADGVEAPASAGVPFTPETADLSINSAEAIRQFTEHLKQTPPYTSWWSVLPRWVARLFRRSDVSA